ncbi:GntR family transcriptional regulator [Saccharopolyspora terrae]|uniref:GntR family transcriptional regulator n=2 Tax=Saccharopolyspora terrae TaxID=2530384 RepID=A0A4R4VAR3_9PSEU|nr:GntR family transcriptional regulator [Saccharopolyspora terrae]
MFCNVRARRSTVNLMCQNIEYADRMAANDAREDKRRASQRVADALQGRIDAGEFAPKEQLPPYRTLAAEYSVALGTAINAVKLLRDAGIVKIRPNAGAYVPEPSEQLDVVAELKRARAQLATLDETAKEMGSTIRSLETRLAEITNQLDESS